MSRPGGNRIAAFYLLTVATPASAEVMDKEPSIPGIWVWALVGALAGWSAIRWRWWMGLVSLPFAVLRPLTALVELRDPYVGQAIDAEAGTGYGLHAILALVLVIAAHLLGWARHVRRRRR